MIQGEPLEETARHGAQDDDTDGCGPVMAVVSAGKPADRQEDAEGAAEGVTPTGDLLARTMQSAESPEGEGDADVDASGTDSLDADVKALVASIASVEQAHDDAWLEAAQRDGADDAEDVAEDAAEDFGAAADDAGSQEPPAVIAMPGPSVVAREDDTASDTDDDADADADEPEETVEAVTAIEPEAIEPVEDTLAPAIEPAPAPVADTPAADAPKADESPNLLGLQAIGVLNEKISSTEERYDGALAKIGHALGVIAERIDGLETRMTSQTIASVAMDVAPSRMEPASFAGPASRIEDDSVAPYIAQAERELAAKKESGPMDIFDRIARAAETEFDGQSAATGTRVIENASDGRRVGTKRWQPSKTVKRRMEQLEKAKTGTAAGEFGLDLSGDGPRSLRAEVEEIAGAAPAMQAEPKARDAILVDPKQDEMSAAPDLDIEDEDDEDAGLSVVPGARGRRRNRARKSRLDSDFENVFAEDGAPSIQNLRRKMRERPSDEDAPEEEAAAKGGMLGGFLGKKSAARAAPVEAPEEMDEDEDLMAAFDAPSERAAKPAKGKGKVKARKAELDAVTEDGEAGGASFAGGPLLYVLIAGLAAAGFFAYMQFMG